LFKWAAHAGTAPVLQVTLGVPVTADEAGGVDDGGGRCTLFWAGGGVREASLSVVALAGEGATTTDVATIPSGTSIPTSKDKHHIGADARVSRDRR
jgi:hypothetical protein